MMIHARGPVWHRKPQQQGIIPEALCGLDTDATWSYSKSDGWVYGHGTFCMVACKNCLLGTFKWMRGNENNRGLFAAMGVVVQMHQYRAWTEGRSTWAIKQEVLGR